MQEQKSYKMIIQKLLTTSGLYPFHRKLLLSHSVPNQQQTLHQHVLAIPDVVSLFEHSILEIN